jgi:hypothetical protein
MTADLVIESARFKRFTETLSDLGIEVLDTKRVEEYKQLLIDAQTNWAGRHEKATLRALLSSSLVALVAVCVGLVFSVLTVVWVFWGIPRPQPTSLAGLALALFSVAVVALVVCIPLIVVAIKARTATWKEDTCYYESDYFPLAREIRNKLYSKVPWPWTTVHCQVISGMDITCNFLGAKNHSSGQYIFFLVWSGERVVQRLN